MTTAVLLHTDHTHLTILTPSPFKEREEGVSPGGEDKSEQHEANLDGEYCGESTKQKSQIFAG